jgi:uncharacterized membrane protein YqaE (UPF0057 family)
MKTIKKLSLFAMVGLILGACSTSNNVMNNHLITKRKYTKGFHFNTKKHFKSAKTDKTEELAFNTSEEGVNDMQMRRSNDLAFNETANTELQRSNLNQVQVVENTEVKAATTQNTGSKSEKVKRTNANDLNIVSWSNNTREKVAEIKQLQKEKQASKKAADDTVMLVLLVILAFIIPPLAVFIYEGATSRFWIDLILAIIGFGVGFWLLGGIGWLAGLAAVIYALLIVLAVI